LKGIELVVFDFDQTIADSPKGFDIAFKKVMDEFKVFLETHGHPIELEPFHPDLRKLMRELDQKRQYNRDLWWNRLLKKMGISDIQFNAEECKKLTRIYWDITAEHTELYPDTLEILEYLRNKGYKLGLITDTDGSPGIKKRRLERSGLLSYFDGILIAGDDLPQIKPDPTPFLKLAELLGVPPIACVMIGDKPFTDIKGGKAAGFRTILILRENWKVDPKPDFQIHELSDLKSIL